MNKYETVVVFDPSLGETRVKEEIEKIKKLLEAQGADLSLVDMWGKREIAYQLRKGHSHGTYACFYFSSTTGEVIEKLTLALRLDESVILFQTHRLSDKVRKFQGRPQGEEKSDSDAGDSAVA